MAKQLSEIPICFKHGKAMMDEKWSEIGIHHLTAYRPGVIMKQQECPQCFFEEQRKKEVYDVQEQVL